MVSTATDTAPAVKSVIADDGTEKPTTRARRSRTSWDEENNGAARYFLSKSNGNDGTLAFGREMASEGEALVEALRLGVTYYEIQEYRVVPDFSGRKPLLGKEAVNSK